MGAKRTELVKVATKRLAEIRMVVVDSPSGSLQITDLGRIAAKYYIRYASIELFNKEFRPKMSEADVLAMLSQSTEVCAEDFICDQQLILIASLTKSNFANPKCKNLRD